MAWGDIASNIDGAGRDSPNSTPLRDYSRGPKDRMFALLSVAFGFITFSHIYNACTSTTCM